MPGFGGAGWEDDVVYCDVRGGRGNEVQGGTDGRVWGEGMVEAEASELGGLGFGIGTVDGVGVGLRVVIGVALVGGGGYQGSEVEITRLFLLVRVRWILNWLS